MQHAILDRMAPAIADAVHREPAEHRDAIRTRVVGLLVVQPSVREAWAQAAQVVADGHIIAAVATPVDVGAERVLATLVGVAVIAPPPADP